MFKKILFVFASLVASASFAFAQVDVNKADQAALDGIKGLGPAKSKAILSERKKHGEFKDWADFESRVKGIGEKSAVKLSEAGLTVNGKLKAPETTTAPASAPVPSVKTPVPAPAVDNSSKPASAAKATPVK